MKLGNIVRSKCNISIFLPDEKELAGLSTSIEENGLINRIVLRQVGDDIECIAGFKRLEALKLKRGVEGELMEGEYVMTDYDDKKAYSVSLDENMRRFDMSTAELAEAAWNLRTYFGDELKNPSAVAKKLGVSQARASMLLELRDDKEKVPDVLKVELKKAVSKHPLCNEFHWHHLRGIQDDEPELFQEAVKLLLEGGKHRKEVTADDLAGFIKDSLGGGGEGGEGGGGGEGGEGGEGGGSSAKNQKNTVAEWKFKGKARFEDELIEDEGLQEVFYIGSDKIDFAAIKESLMQYDCVMNVKISAYAKQGDDADDRTNDE